MKIDKKHRLPITKVWKYENDFSDWLCQNTDFLSECLNIEINEPAREQSTTNFRVDIKATDSFGNIVVIENQYGQSNHDHLGKLLTYRTAYNANTAIWIVEEARQEHVETVNWLNETDNGCDFFLVKIEVLESGQDSCIPQFIVLSGPNEDSKDIGKIKKDDAKRFSLRYAFWTKFIETCKLEGLNLFQNINPTKDGWIGAGAGRQGVGYYFWVTQYSIRAELRIDRGKGKAEENRLFFSKLKEHRPHIEKVFGPELSSKMKWIESESVQMRCVRIDLEKGGYLSEEEKIVEAINEAIETMKVLVKATKNIIKDIAVKI